MAGFDNDICYFTDLDPRGVQPVTGQMGTDGTLLIGASSGNPVRTGTLTAGSGIGIVNAAGSITISATATVPLQFNTDGAAATPAANAITIAGGTNIVTSGSGSTVTIDFDGTLPVASGGTGATTLTGVVIGNGTSPMTATSITEHAIVIGAASDDIAGVGPLTNGQLLIGSSGVAPVAGSLTQPAAGLTITGGTGSITFALANDLAALEGLGSTGIAVRTGADAWAQRSVAGTTNRIDVTNGDGVSGNPTIDIAATYVGQSSITTLGTITTGTWNGTTIGETFGGTGQTTYATGDILYASAANTLSKLAAGTDGEVLTLASGVPSWAASGGGGNSPSLTPTNGLAVCDFVGPADLDGGWQSNSGVSYNTGIIEGRFGVTGDTDVFFSRYVTTGTYALTYECIGKVNYTLASLDHINIGLTNTATSIVSVSDGAYFRLQYDASGTEKWIAVTENSNTETTTDTGVQYDSNWHSFKIEINAAGTSVAFYIDGTLEATHTTNLPTTGGDYYMNCIKSSVPSDGFLIDLLVAGADYNGSRY